jgi:cell division protein FtsI/penicillin-binding protein 2
LDGGIANEGTLYKPHLAKYFVDEDGKKTEKAVEFCRIVLQNRAHLEVTKEGMRSAVSGPTASISWLSNVGVEVAAKTGTAEFGALNKDGKLEHSMHG